MTPFAMVFMIVSMVSVSVLAGYCLYRILTSKPPSTDD